MAKSLILHPIAHISQPVEILALGRVRANPGLNNHEPQIEVCVGKIDAANRTTDPFVVWVGVGQLNLLVPGHRFKGGQPMGEAPKRHQRGRLSLHPQGRTETLGAGTFEGRLQANHTDSVSECPGWLLAHESIEGDGKPSPTLVFLPKTVLIRALFGSSSTMLKQLIDGRRDKSVLPTRFSWDRESSSVDSEGKVVIVVDRKIDRSDVMVLAALQSDPSKKLLKCYYSINQQFNVESGFRDKNGLYLDFEWPWSAAVEFEFRGRWLRRVPKSSAAPDSKWPSRFVIDEITKIFSPYPISSIEVRYPDEMLRDPEAPLSAGRTLLAKSGTRTIRSDVAPKKARGYSTIDVGTSFASLDALEIKWTPGSAYKGPPGISIRPDEVDGETFLSTDDAVSGGDAATGQVNIRRSSKSQRDPATDAALAHDQSILDGRRKTWEALASLAANRKWHVSYFVDGNPQPKPEASLVTDSLVESPVLAIVETNTGLVAVADVGSTPDRPASLGVYADPKEDMKSLALVMFQKGQACGWKWLQRSGSGGDKPKSSAKEAGKSSENMAGESSKNVAEKSSEKVAGHRRSAKCWSDPKHYQSLLEEWLEEWLKH